MNDGKGGGRWAVGGLWGKLKCFGLFAGFTG